MAALPHFLLGDIHRIMGTGMEVTLDTLQDEMRVQAAGD